MLLIVLIQRYPLSKRAGNYGTGWLMIHNLLDNEAAQLLKAIATEEATEVPVK